MAKNKNVDKLASFVVYCTNNPSLRFWQALRGWAGVNFILTSMLPPGMKDSPSEDLEFIEQLHDTFYDEK